MERCKSKGQKRAPFPSWNVRVGRFQTHIFFAASSFAASDGTTSICCGGGDEGKAGGYHTSPPTTTTPQTEATTLDVAGHSDGHTAGVPSIGHCPNPDADRHLSCVNKDDEHCDAARSAITAAEDPTSTYTHAGKYA